MREISDDEYNFLQGRRQIADFIEPIYNDPLLNREAKALIKKKYPQAQIADYDLEEKFNQRLDAEKKEREDAEKAKLEAEQQQKFQTIRSQVQKDYGFTEDGMKELEKFMWDKNIGDYEVAATYHAAKNPRQSETAHGDGFWHHQKQDGFAKIAEDPEGWARNEILGALRNDQERARGGR